MAPELINGKHCGFKVDVWSATVAVYVMLCGKPPFRAKDREAMFESIVQDELVFKGKSWNNVSS